MQQPFPPLGPYQDPREGDGVVPPFSTQPVPPEQNGKILAYEPPDPLARGWLVAVDPATGAGTWPRSADDRAALPCPARTGAGCRSGSECTWAGGEYLMPQR